MGKNMKRKGEDLNKDAILSLFSNEAEKAILGLALTNPELVFDRIRERIAADDFYVPSHRLLFEVLCDMHSKSIPIDLTTVHQYLIDHHLEEKMGGAVLLADLVASFATHLNLESYIKILKDKSVLRKLHQVALNIVQSIYENSHSVIQVLDQAEKEIFEITDLTITRSTVKASIEIEKAIELIDCFHKRKGRLFGIPTGFYHLDQITTGWQNGDMIVLAARPGVGKTALGLTFACRALKERYDQEKDLWIKPGYAVGFFSLEMTAVQIMLRLLASIGSESLQKIRRGELEPASLEKLKMLADDAKEWPFYIDDSSDLTIHQLRAKARRMKNQFGVDLIIIDYLQLLHSDSEQARENRQVEISEISRGIKALAKELNIPIIVLAQLNRRMEEGKSEPALHHLRESGAIEQDADVVLLLHRLENDPETDHSKIPYIIHVAKQRNGPTDKIEIFFNAPYTRFEDPLKHETDYSSF
ncbi:Replicative DNA helicase [Methylacidiphilum infernorum V4]|uniref:Replicative DNA helicase n=2 Tax=Candidatus Methylacidiphilum infernorum TaxID=511746 RepID=B3E0Y0_METI4|nr:Replicative DNA helicase [Methylacidiphilum infernorum V4]